MPLGPPNRIPLSTYRLQLNAGFPFEEAQRWVPYLKRLGITECYCSSILAAKPGSTHGYDLCDHSRINPEIGGREGFQHFSDTLRTNGLGLILDFVPNHMSTDPSANRWWRSVLANGPSSPYASFFDIDWHPVKSELANKVLLPILGEQYGVTLESGQLQIVFEAGSFHLQYFDLNLPLNPRQLRILLGYNLDSLIGSVDATNELNEFRSVLFQLQHMPAYTETDRELVDSRQRETEVAMRRIGHLAEESSSIRKHIEDNIRRFNGIAGESSSFDLLHQLLELQPYRLSSWRTAMHEINYRRFFDINELAGIRMEEPEAFRRTHTLVFELMRNGEVHGIRLDHIDGLYDPSAYLEALTSSNESPEAPYVVVEKILSPGEVLCDDWKTHGTTGYEFLNDLNGLFVDSQQEYTLRKLHHRFIGREQNFDELVYDCKKLIIEASMASELNVLAHELNRISEHHREFRDFTLDSLQQALREIVACFPVYRSYVDPDGWGEFDERNIDEAVSRALRRNPALEPSIFHFIRQMLLPTRIGTSEEDFNRRLRFSMKFQQYTGPVQAKGVEDTAFYRYGPLLSLNEVGGTPDRFGRTPQEFHSANEYRQKCWPLTMVTTSTHDTKRGEDARARINVLSEIPSEWSAAISRWARANSSARTLVMGEQAPDRSDEYFYYQALIGAWPAEPVDTPDPAFVQRMRGYLQKAVKEKKTHTSWIHPSEAYDTAVSDFVERTLTGSNSRLFLSLFVPLQERVARLGMLNALSQLVLKLGSPGVPDFYQGAELWDLSLVDPDNRRPVDFALREQQLNSIEPLLDENVESAAKIQGIKSLLLNWQDGRIKLYCTAAGLRKRSKAKEVFSKGSYVALETDGDASQHVVAFARAIEEAQIVVVAPRLVAGLRGSSTTLPLGEETWGDTTVRFPEGLAKGQYRNILTGEILSTAAPSSSLRVAEIFNAFPVAILEQLDGAS